MLFHPVEKICVRAESLTAGKDFSQAFAGALDQLAQKRIRIAIDISEECQIQRITAWRQTIDSDIFGGFVVKNNESREMERRRTPRKATERYSDPPVRALGSSNQATAEAPSRAPVSIGARTMKFD